MEEGYCSGVIQPREMGRWGAGEMGKKFIVSDFYFGDSSILNFVCVAW